MPDADAPLAPSSAADDEPPGARPGPWHRWWARLGRILRPPPDPPPALVCTAGELARLASPAWLATRTQVVDDPTWRDLQLDLLLTRLSRRCSVFGQQLLHRRLRGGGNDAERARAVALAQDPERTRRLRTVCAPLQRVEAELSGLLFAQDFPDLPAWVRRLGQVPLLLLASLAGLAWTPWAGVPLLVALGLSLHVQIRLYLPMQRWQLRMGAIEQLLAVATPLRQDFAAQPALSPFPADHPSPATLASALRGPRLHRLNALAAVAEYSNLLFLSQYRHFVQQAEAVRRHRDALAEVFLAVGSIEAELCVADHLRDTPVHCVASFTDERRAEFEALHHPLLPGGGHALDLRLDGAGRFLTGQNGVGKSTLLRAVGLNAVLAGAFGLCHARSARLPRRRVMSSLQVEDSLLAGESLFVAELARARQILDAARQGPGVLVLIDEIFRGTNHLESVCAAAATLRELAHHALLLVSSHHTVLAALLRNELDACCLRRSGDGPAAGLVLEAGVLTDTNGIALMRQQGFDPRLVDEAFAIARWLGDYLAHPSEPPPGALRGGT